MARFSFRLQSVLNLKVRLEEQQRNAFAAAKKHLDDEEEKLKGLYRRLDEYEQKGRDMRSASLNVMEIIENEAAITRMKEFIAAQKEQVRLAEKKLDEERAKLVEMMQERKMYEKLREKAFDSFMEDEKHSEGVLNDEHNSYVYGIKEA